MNEKNHSNQGLENIPLFAGLSSEMLMNILSTAVEKNYSADEMVFFQGDPANRIFVVKAGKVKVTQLTPDGQQVILRMIGPWTMFGAIALAQGETYPISAQTVDHSILLSWDKKSMMDFVQGSSKLALNAIRMMSQHLQEFQDRFREMATERVERRIARTLLRLASQTGKRVPEGVLIDLPLTRQDVAEMTGTTLYTVSRILSQWETQNIIIAGREKIIIRFPHGLVSIAEDLPAKKDL